MRRQYYLIGPTPGRPGRPPGLGPGRGVRCRNKSESACPSSMSLKAGQQRDADDMVLVRVERHVRVVPGVLIAESQIGLIRKEMRHHHLHTRRHRHVFAALCRYRYVDGLIEAAAEGKTP